MRFLEFHGFQDSFSYYIVLNDLEGRKALLFLLFFVYLFLRIVEVFLRLGFGKLFLEVRNLCLLFVNSGF